MNRHTFSRGLACVVLLGFATVTTATAPSAEAKCPPKPSTLTTGHLYPPAGMMCTPRDT